MFRITLSIGFVLATTLLGCWFSSGLTSRRKTLEAISESITKAGTLISFESYEITRVVKETFGKIKGFEHITEICADGQNFMESFSKCIDLIPHECFLTDDDKDSLKSFSQGLGISDLMGQTSNCELYKKLFDEKINEAKEKEKSLSRLYKIMGFSLGCVVALMIL